MQQDSPRQQKVARMIQETLSELFQKNRGYWFEQSLVTVTSVQMTPDMGLAKVFLSVLPEAQGDPVVERFTSRTSEVRKMLGDRIRNKMRNIPDLLFYLDDSAAYAARMDKLFSKLDIPKDEEE